MISYGKVLPTQHFWRYVDELDGRGLDLSYPEEVIKGVKRLFLTTEDKINKIIDSKDPITVFINNPQDGIPYEAILSPNISKTIKAHMNYELATVVRDHVYNPNTEDLMWLFLEQDKYFSMCLALRKELPIIVHNIKIGNYRYASILIASLTNRYNMEVVHLINDYFNTHKFYDEHNKCWYSYYIVNNRTYIISPEVYVAVLIYRYRINYDVAEKHADLIYENYDVLTDPDPEHTIKRTSAKSFLQDCKAVALVKKELTHEVISIIEFHDLIRYGGYNDSILSIENINKVSEIFGHRKWLHQFFVALGLYCDNYINLEHLESEMKSQDKAVLNPRKLQDIDLFMQTVHYFDSIYDSLIRQS